MQSAGRAYSNFRPQFRRKQTNRRPTKKTWSLLQSKTWLVGSCYLLLRREICIMLSILSIVAEAAAVILLVLFAVSFASVCLSYCIVPCWCKIY